MVIYKGVRTSGGMGGQKVLKDGEPLSPAPSLKLHLHSPDGFNWGYGGSGPAQLALALLCDVTKDKDIALANYQDFKWCYVAQWGEHWQITDEEIRDWLIERR